MQAVGQHVDLRVGPFDELAVHPDEAVELIEGDGCHFIPPAGAQPARLSLLHSYPSKQLFCGQSLGRCRGERKLRENSAKAVFPCLFVRNRSKSLSKITSSRKLSQYG